MSSWFMAAPETPCKVRDALSEVSSAPIARRFRETSSVVSVATLNRSARRSIKTMLMDRFV